MKNQIEVQWSVNVKNISKNEMRRFDSNARVKQNTPDFGQRPATNSLRIWVLFSNIHFYFIIFQYISVVILSYNRLTAWVQCLLVVYIWLTKRKWKPAVLHLRNTHSDFKDHLCSILIYRSQSIFIWRGKPFISLCILYIFSCSNLLL